MYRFPQNLKSIADPAKFKEYCLNPLGIKLGVQALKPKPQKVEKFVNFGLKIHRTEKELQKNEFAAKIFNNQENISKFEIKQYLEKIYGLDVQKVHTLNHMGRLARNHKGQYKKRERDFKKAYIYLNEDVDPQFQRLQKD